MTGFTVFLMLREPRADGLLDQRNAGRPRCLQPRLHHKTDLRHQSVFGQPRRNDWPDVVRRQNGGQPRDQQEMSLK